MERIAHSPDEADLPAQEATSSQGAWLPRQDADLRWPTDPGRPPRARPQTADGLTGERGPTAPRLVVLSRPRDFRALQGDGFVRSDPLLAVRFRRTDLESTRVGLSTGRRLGGAVVRNRVRRRLREILRALAPSFQPGWDVLIIARPAVVDASHHDIAEAVGRLLRKGGVVGGPVTA